jgi:hypothetical protein
VAVYCSSDRLDTLSGSLSAPGDRYEVHLVEVAGYPCGWGSHAKGDMLGGQESGGHGDGIDKPDGSVQAAVGRKGDGVPLQVTTSSSRARLQAT